MPGHEQSEAHVRKALHMAPVYALLYEPESAPVPWRPGYLGVEPVLHTHEPGSRVVQLAGDAVAGCVSLSEQGSGKVQAPCSTQRSMYSKKSL